MKRSKLTGRSADSCDKNESEDKVDWGYLPKPLWEDIQEYVGPVSVPNSHELSALTATNLPMLSIELYLDTGDWENEEINWDFPKSMFGLGVVGHSNFSVQATLACITALHLPEKTCMLQHLNFEGLNWTSRTISFFKSALQRNKSLVELCLGMAAVSNPREPGTSLLCAVVEAKAPLTELRFVSINDDMLLLLGKALETSTSLKRLILFGCNVNCSGLELISKALVNNRSLEELNLKLTQVTTLGQFPSKLKSLPTLKRLGLAYNRLSLPDVQDMLVTLAKNQCNLETLDLNRTHLGWEQAVSVGKALLTNKTLVTLYLVDNCLGDMGIHVIARALMENTTLLNLDLQNTGFGERGACSLAGALRTNVTLENLDVSCNNFSEYGMELLLQAYEEHPTLEINI